MNEELDDIIALLKADTAKPRVGKAKRVAKKAADELPFRIQLKETLETLQNKVSSIEILKLQIIDSNFGVNFLFLSFVFIIETFFS